MGQHIHFPQPLGNSAELATLRFFASNAEERAAWPEAERLAVEAEAKREFLLEDSRRESLARLADIFRAEKIDFLVLKGSALAYQVYPAPWVRSRLDTDVLVRPADVARVEKILRARGWRKVAGAGEAARKQFTYTEGGGWSAHPFDIHWQLINTYAFANLWAFDELYASAETLSSFPAEVRGLGMKHALAHAALHRVVHHHNDPGRLWLYDLHLIAAKLGEAGLRDAAEDAAARGFFSILRASLAATDAAFGTSYVTQLGRDAPARSEPSALYLRASRKFWQDFLLDLYSATGAKARLSYVLAHLFPPLEAMRAKYPRARARTLPFYYLARVVSGFSRLFSRTLP